MPPPPSRRRRAAVPLLVSLALLAAAVVIGRSTLSLQLSGLRARGTVIALRLNSSRTYAPRVRFQTNNGDIIEFEGEGSNPPDHHVGEAVEVMYEADRPTHAIINRGVRNWLMPAVFGLCAVPIAVWSLRALL